MKVRARDPIWRQMRKVAPLAELASNLLWVSDLGEFVDMSTAAEPGS